MQRIDYNVINSAKNTDGRMSALEAEVARCGYVSLTDALAHPDMCGPVMLAWLQQDEAKNMRTGQQQKWHIQVLTDEWGNKPSKGGIVKRKLALPPVDKAGRTLRSNVVKDMQRRGTWERDYVETREFVIDEKGCIECSYDDAVYFLSQYGIHFETRAGLCGRREISSRQCKSPEGGMKYIRYWRYVEAPPWVYKDLDKIKKA